jgi:ankyrin repeat protein
MSDLLTAIQKYDIPKIKKILNKNGSDLINEKDKKGRFPLMIASFLGFEDIVEMLLDARANIDQTDNGYTALYIASINGHEDIVKILLDRGANWMIEDKDGKNAISVAASLKIKKLIIEQEEQKWEKMLEDEKFTEFDELDYKDKDLKDAYNKFRSRVEASMVDQMLYSNKSVFLDEETRAAIADGLGEGEGKKRKKSIRKKKRRKVRKSNKKM